MDNFIVRWYNQNRKIIWVAILTVVAVIGLIQTLNSYYKNKAKDENSSTNSTTVYDTPNYSVITREQIDEKTSEKSIDLIGEFFNLCNNGQIEKAYNLISTECKEELYPTLGDFETYYYNKIFTEQKSYDSVLWINSAGRNTYKIEIMADLLATGQKENMPIEDFYTIIYENGEYKLNISNYIGKKEINTSKKQNNIEINILDKRMYIDYEIYDIQIQNNTGNRLIFNTKEHSNSIYLQDENELKYIAFLNEIPNSELEIINGITKILEIKFNRGYKPTINIEKIVFGDINSNGKIENIEIEL